MQTRKRWSNILKSTERGWEKRGKKKKKAYQPGTLTVKITFKNEGGTKTFSLSKTERILAADLNY